MQPSSALSRGVELVNPFTPTFGEVPPIFAGRQILLNELCRAYSSPARRPSLTLCVSGARGSGKTALLAAASQEAQARGWVVASTTALPGMLEDILERAREGASHLIDPPSGHQLTSVGIGQIVELGWSQPPTAPANWRSRMNSLLDVLAEQSVGLLITVDELQPELDEMVQLAAVYQHFVRENRRVGLLMAGLPFNVSRMLRHKSVSFLRRSESAFLGRLADTDVRDALRDTIEQGGRTVGEDALDRMTNAVGGFPYLLQLVGFKAWDQSPRNESISVGDATAGIEAAQRDMMERVLPATYDELSDGDVLFLEAMLEDPEVSSMGVIAQRLGKSSSYASQYKRRLLEQGVIGERRRGEVAFELPYMREFLLTRR